MKSFGLIVLSLFVWVCGAFGQGSSNVEAYTIAAPPSVERSVEALAEYLKGAGPSDEIRVTAVYAWVAHKIAYDGPLFVKSAGRINIGSEEEMRKDPRFAGQLPSVVLARRQAVCLGYSRLVKALCDSLHIPCIIVHGWGAATPASRIQLQTQNPNHAWNVVRVGAIWKVLDATWGAGYLDDQNRFVAAYSDSLLMSEPEAFLMHHLPTDPAFQLQSYPKTKASFFAGRADYPQQGGTYLYTDTLNGLYRLPEEEAAFATARRALAYDPTALFARIKVSQYYSLRAVARLQDYQKGIEAYNRQEIASATPAMLQALDASEADLRLAKKYFTEIPATQLRQLPQAKENIANIDRNLAMIRQQRVFWAKNQP